MNFDYIALIRCGTRTARAWRLRETMRAGPPRNGRGLVFLHGEGTRLAAGNAASLAATVTADATVVVCRTSWRRRHGGAQPDARWSLGSLASLCGSLESAARVDSFGARSAVCALGRGTGPVLFLVDAAPENRDDAVETLELVLAAAALEVDGRVLFTGDGLAHLSGERGDGWRQLVDHDLMPLGVEGATDAAVPARCVRLDGDGVRRWVGQARTVVAP